MGTFFAPTVDLFQEDYIDDGLDDPADKWDDQDDFWAAADRAYEVER